MHIEHGDDLGHAGRVVGAGVAVIECGDRVSEQGARVPYLLVELLYESIGLLALPRAVGEGAALVLDAALEGREGGVHLVLMMEDELELLGDRIGALLQSGARELQLEGTVTLDDELAVELVDFVGLLYESVDLGRWGGGGVGG